MVGFLVALDAGQGREDVRPVVLGVTVGVLIDPLRNDAATVDQGDAVADAGAAAELDAEDPAQGLRGEEHRALAGQALDAVVGAELASAVDRRADVGSVGVTDHQQCRRLQLAGASQELLDFVEVLQPLDREDQERTLARQAADMDWLVLRDEPFHRPPERRHGGIGGEVAQQRLR